jgi:hypothetical protein
MALLQVFLTLAGLRGVLALDADALSQRYRNWHYYPDWIIPPICLNPFTCKSNTSQTTTDVVQVFQIPGDTPGLWRAVYLQFDGTGYETYMATSSDMVSFNLSNPTLAPGQPGCIFSPRAGRPPLAGYKPQNGEFDFGGITFIGPLLDNYTVGAPATLKKTSKGSMWYAYGAYPSFGYESGPGADGMASSQDGMNWVRASPKAIVDTVAGHGAQPWESKQVYAPFLFPALDGSLGDFYNAANAGGHEQSGVAYLPGGAEALPGFDFATNTSLWVRDPANPLITNDVNASYQAADPKVFYDAEQGVWINIYFCNGNYPTPPYAGGANICMAFSTDQKVWVKASTPIYAHGGHPKGYDSEHAHKSWLTTDPKTGIQCEFCCSKYSRVF